MNCSLAFLKHFKIVFSSFISLETESVQTLYKSRPYCMK